MFKPYSVLLASTVLLCTPICTQAENLGRVVGKVTVEKTGEPVPGATIMALIGMSKDRPGRQYAMAEARTNNKGEYELTVPFGNIWLEPPQPPAGFWNSDAKPLDQFVAARKAPTIRRDFTVKTGGVWNLKLESAVGKPLAAVNILVSTGPISYWRTITDQRGEGHFTVPFDGSELKLGCGVVWGYSERKIPILPSKSVTIRVPKEFDAGTIKTVEKPGSGEIAALSDDQGHKAIIEGCAVVLVNGTPRMRLIAEEPGESSVGEIAGKVVDEQGALSRTPTYLA